MASEVGIATASRYTDGDITTTETVTETVEVELDPNTIYNITDIDSADTDLSNITDNGKSVIDSRITAVMSTYVTSTYVDDTSGYRVWSDGYCEQWSSVNTGSTVGTVTLSKPYKDTNYSVLFSAMQNSGSTVYYYNMGYFNQTTSSFQTRSGSVKMFWKAEGYIS